MNAPLRPARTVGGFSLIELLIVLAIIGVLLALLLPAVQAAREAARRTACLNNLRQIGIGLHQYHEATGSFPQGCIEKRTREEPDNRQLAWSIFLLPYVEQEAIYEQVHLDKKYDGAENADVAARVLEIYICPTVSQDKQLRSGRGACHYGGMNGERITPSRNNPPNGVMLEDRKVSIAEIRDGTSQTLIIAEDSEFRDGQWINGGNIFDQAFPINQAPAFDNNIHSEHTGGAHGLFCDGSVHFLQETMDLDTLAAICTRAGGETAVLP